MKTWGRIGTSCVFIVLHILLRRITLLCFRLVNDSYVDIDTDTIMYLGLGLSLGLTVAQPTKQSDSGKYGPEPAFTGHEAAFIHDERCPRVRAISNKQQHYLHDTSGIQYFRLLNNFADRRKYLSEKSPWLQPNTTKVRRKINLSVTDCQNNWQCVAN